MSNKRPDQLVSQKLFMAEIRITAIDDFKDLAEPITIEIFRHIWVSDIEFAKLYARELCLEFHRELDKNGLFFKFPSYRVNYNRDDTYTYTDLDAIEKLLSEIDHDSLVCYDDGDPLSSLIGSVISAVYVDDEEFAETITFETGLIDTVSFSVRAGCCSESWIADFYNLSEIIGSPVVEIKTVDLDASDHYNSRLDGRCRQGVDIVYGYRIRVENGSCAVFSFRNSSDGYYYGGWIRETQYHTSNIKISNELNWLSL